MEQPLGVERVERHPAIDRACERVGGAGEDEVAALRLAARDRDAACIELPT